MALKENENSDGPRSKSETLEALFSAHETGLLLYARRFTRSPEVAQDIVQEAFMRLHAHFDTVEQPKHWLFRTVRNLSLNHCRDEKKIVPLENNDPDKPATEPPDPAPWPDEHIERLEAIGQARVCIQALDQRSRELVRLKFEEGLSYKEMSQRTGLSVSNVGYILHHALKSLAAELQRTGISS